MITRSSQPRKPTGFLAEAGMGLLFSVSGSFVFAGLQWFVDPATALRIVIAALGAAAIMRCLTKRRTGRLVLFCIWLGAAAAIWLMPTTLPIYVAIHAGLLWFVRSVHNRTGVPQALADAGVTILAIAGAAWASVETGSPFMAFWCFFLVLSLSATIRKPMLAIAGDDRAPSKPLDRFDAAHRDAKTALADLISTR